jgi:hypothetical protein
MFTQSTQGYSYGHIIASDWLQDDSTLNFQFPDVIPSSEQLPDVTPSSEHGSEATLRSSDIMTILQEIKKSVDDLNTAISENRRELDDTRKELRGELHPFRETFADLQKEYVYPSLKFMEVRLL